MEIVFNTAADAIVLSINDLSNDLYSRARFLLSKSDCEKILELAQAHAWIDKFESDKASTIVGYRLNITYDTEYGKVEISSSLREEHDTGVFVLILAEALRKYATNKLLSNHLEPLVKQVN